MPQTLRSVLQKPYLVIDFDEDTQIRIPATRDEINRIRDGADAFEQKLASLSSEDGPAVEQVKEAFEFLCGPKVGADLYTRCIRDMLGDDSGYTEEDLVYQLVPVLEYIEFRWLEYISNMEVERSERVQKYLGRSQGAVL